MLKGFLKEHSSTIMGLLVLIDFSVLLGCGLLSYYFIFGNAALHADYKLALFLSGLLAATTFPYHGLYRAWRGANRLAEFNTIVFAWFSLFLLLGVSLYILGVLSQIEKNWLISWFVGSFSVLICCRFIFRTFLRKIRSSGYNQRHIVIFSAANVGRQALQKIDAHPESGFKTIGFFSDGHDCPEGDGNIQNGLAFLNNHHVDQVWLAMPFSEGAQIRQIMDELKYSTVNIRLIPDIFDFRLLNHSVTSVVGLPVLDLSVSPMNGINRYIKGLQDRVIAAVILACISPLMAAIAVGVKRSSPGPVFYRQQRVSINGELFQMLKFRSMPVNTEQQSGAVWAKGGENRATHFGSFLRKTSLDELPQFINVLAGEMSIVGPRPERPIFVDKFKNEIPGYMQKHMMKAGITGWAQINGWRGDTNLHKRIEYDLHYIDNWSLWLDVKIIVLTIFKGFVNKNAY